MIKQTTKGINIIRYSDVFRRYNGAFLRSRWVLRRRRRVLKHPRK